MDEKPESPELERMAELVHRTGRVFDRATALVAKSRRLIARSRQLQKKLKPAGNGKPDAR
jgi:hypothetical protein